MGFFRVQSFAFREFRVLGFVTDVPHIPCLAEAARCHKVAGCAAWAPSQASAPAAIPLHIALGSINARHRKTPKAGVPINPKKPIPYVNPIKSIPNPKP